MVQQLEAALKRALRARREWALAQIAAGVPPAAIVRALGIAPVSLWQWRVEAGDVARNAVLMTESLSPDGGASQSTQPAQPAQPSLVSD